MLRITLACLALGACTTEYRVERAAKECTQYGYQAGTPEMIDCVAAEIQSRRQAGAVLVAGQ